MSEFESVVTETVEERPPKKFSPFAAITVVQAVFVTVIIATLLIVKFLFPSLFADIKKHYTERFTATTTISEVIQNTEEESVVGGDEV